MRRMLTLLLGDKVTQRMMISPWLSNRGLLLPPLLSLTRRQGCSACFEA